MSCRTSNNEVVLPQKTLIPASVTETCNHLHRLGGSVYLVGGAVRDLILGVTPKDFDIEVYGIAEGDLLKHLSCLGKTEAVGRQFGVIKLWRDGQEIDIALPRKEYKTEPGHRGFDVRADHNLSPETATLRRDFTINAMMFDPVANRLLDLHHGAEHLRLGILKHVSPAFAEDPLRVLRGMQFAARFKLKLDPETAALCHALLSEAGTLPASRIWIEWQKWCHAEHPSYGLQALRDSGWVALYPELEAMIDCPQDQRWHPEGDVWLHTLQVVDQAADIANRYHWQDELREQLLFAALCHDLGKPACTFIDEHGVIKSPGHSHEGMADSNRFLKRIFAPRKFNQIILPLVQEHMTHMHGEPTPRAVRHLAHRLTPATIKLWEALVEADASGRAPASPSRPALEWLQQAEEMAAHLNQPSPFITGKTLIDLGKTPGPELGEILNKAYQAQLNGEFDDPHSANDWIRAYLNRQ
ncbi:MAG TPA: HD domain-containing protein [Mariprofundaceae bacterium]|nr:HD domain-containing protein [Mariprofundaceae bacterium]